MSDFNTFLEQTQEIGYVVEANQSMIYVSGLPTAKLQEVVMFETGELGFVLSLSEELVEILLLSKRTIKTGTKVTRTGRKQEMPVGKELFQQTVDIFGLPLDRQRMAPRPTESRPLDTTPGGINTRQRIDHPFETGVTLVDMLVPLGKGQRELVIGDRKTGKTSFLHQTILNQTKQGTICIYAAIGKKKTDIRATEAFFEKAGIADRTVLIASASEDPAGVIFLTPFCAMTVAEYFRDQGNDVLVVLDDLFTHAKFYREISLIGRRFPGRNSYPADIFYTHARLLERAGNFVNAAGTQNSITCLPVVESVQGDIAGFIQTNLMSMTDGHIYFDNDDFAKGRRPAINPFLSVSRVGRQTQTKLRLSLNRELFSFLTLQKRLENYGHFGSEAGPYIKNTLNMGNRIFAFFTQGASEVNDVDLQIVIFGLLWQNVWDTPTEMVEDVKKIQQAYVNNPKAQTYVKELLGSCENLNALLVTLGKDLPKLIEVLGVKLGGKFDMLMKQHLADHKPTQQAVPATPTQQAPQAPSAQQSTQQPPQQGQQPPAQHTEAPAA